MSESGEVSFKKGAALLSEHPLSGKAGIFVWAFALRALMCATTAWLSGISPRNLTLFFDGHLYLLIAKTFPWAYSDVHAVVPFFPKAGEYLTAWFPFYPFLIFVSHAVISDLRVCALVVSWSASSLAVVLFHGLAEGVVPRPWRAAVLFSFLPPAWLQCGSIAFVESVYVCLFLAAMACFLRERRWWTVFFAGLTIVTQKSGVIIMPILFILLLMRRGREAFREFLPYLLSFLPLLLMQAWLFRLFGDPLINIKMQRGVFGGRVLGFPFQTMVSGLFDPTSPFRAMFWPRKIMIGASLLFYLCVFAWSLRQRTKDTEPFVVWLGVVLAFNLSLTGTSAFYGFPRFMTSAAVPAMILLLRLVGRKTLYLEAALFLLPFILIYNSMDALGHLELASRYWKPEYFRQLATYAF